jgi:GT2 family glycosyltransferase
LGWERKDNPRYDKIRECDFVTGCGFLLRSAAVKSIGYFNEDLVFYSEDADLCYRVKEKGFKVLYIPGARMWHKVSTTLAKNRPLQLRYSTRNSLYLIQRHRIGYYPVSLLVNLLLVCPFKMLVFVILLHWRNSAGILQGIRDWKRGRYGWVKN